MSTSVSRFYRVAADAIGTGLGLVLILFSISHPSLVDTGVGLGLVTLGASQLHSDLETAGA
jgi:hypothetical protein